MSSDFCRKPKSATAQPGISPHALNLMKKGKSIPPASTSSALDMIMKCSKDRQTGWERGKRLSTKRVSLIWSLSWKRFEWNAHLSVTRILHVTSWWITVQCSIRMASKLAQGTLLSLIPWLKLCQFWKTEEQLSTQEAIYEVHSSKAAFVSKVVYMCLVESGGQAASWGIQLIDFIWNEAPYNLENCQN